MIYPFPVLLALLMKFNNTISTFWSLRGAGHSSRGILPIVLCLTECDRETSTMRPKPTRAVEPLEKNLHFATIYSIVMNEKAFNKIFATCITSIKN
jgi:hypothetical protein